MSSLLLTCRNKSAAERHYLPAIRLGGWAGEVHVATPGSPVPALEGFKGLLMTGGDDIHPRWWDASEPVHAAAEPDGDRDLMEIPLIQRAWDLGLPILGICRGEQALNVALGGSLIQDLPSRFGLEPEFHRRGSSDRPELAHAVELEPASRLARLVGASELQVNSRHHQAVLRVAPQLRAVAWHRNPPPGIIEAIEAADPQRWVLGLQWHPENLVGLEGPTGAAARAIFEGFATALK